MSEPVVVKSLITPLDQTLRTVFNAQRSYFIDIYQREYKWTQENVRTLLNDIEVRFSQHDRRKANPKEIQEDVLERFEPYFLNTYLTSTTATNTAIHARNLPTDLRFPPVVPTNKVFPLDQVDNRQKALFAAIRHIWATV